MKLTQKIFIITGTSRGLGEALCSYVINKTEHKVISLSRSFTIQQNEFPNNRFFRIPIDFSIIEGFKSLSIIESLIKDEEIIFINNAGVIYPISEVGSFIDKDILNAISVNISAPIIISNFILNHFKNNKITMINITSGAAKYPIKNWSLYNSSKAAINMFFDVMQHEFPTLEFINLDPGVIDTDMQNTIRTSNFEKVNEFIAYKEKGLLKSPNIVADEILSSFI